MIQCPLCSEFVLRLKSGCHVIPRWQIILTKDFNGKYFEISSNKTGSSQTDIKTESWCESCEKVFASLDGYGAIFFRDNPNLLKIRHESNKYVFNSLENYFKFKKFVSSIVIRHHLYALTNHIALIQTGGILNDFYKAYLNKSDIYVELHDMRDFFLSTSGLPIVSQGTIQVVINGFLAVLAVSTESQKSFPLEEGEILFYKVMDYNHPYVKSLAGFMQLRASKVFPRVIL